MTILHNIALGQSRLITSTEFDLTTHTLTRIINSKIYTIQMKRRGDKVLPPTLEDLERLTLIDNESFQLMAELQRSK